MPDAAIMQGWHLPENGNGNICHGMRVLGRCRYAGVKDIMKREDCACGSLSFFEPNDINISLCPN